MTSPFVAGPPLVARLGQVLDKQALGGADRAELQPGDCVVIETPGGGGYGTPSDDSAAKR